MDDSDYYFWSSSPYPEDDTESWVLSVDEDSVLPNVFDPREQKNNVRCFKNYLSIPQPIHTLTLNANGGEVEDDTLETDNE